MADVLHRHGDAYRLAHAGHLGRTERRVMGAIAACRTAALGGHIEACDELRPDARRLQLLPQPPLPEVPGSRAGAMACRAPGRTSAGPLFPRRVHPAGADRGHRVPEQGPHLRDPVRGLGRSDDDARRKPAPARRTDRRPRRPPYLGADAHPSSARPLHRPGRGPLARQDALGRRAAELLPRRQAARKALSPPLPRTPATRVRRGRSAVLQ